MHAVSAVILYNYQAHRKLTNNKRALEDKRKTETNEKKINEGKLSEIF